ncbi:MULTISPECIES: hypothetical protein [unclassified Mesorhizobium]|nr:MULTISPECIES: hypothetical protein [unclassified Mesorhizobium]
MLTARNDRALPFEPFGKAGVAGSPGSLGDIDHVSVIEKKPAIRE